MRFIIDQPVSPLLAEWLKGQGHDAVHVRDRHMSRSTDDQIFDVARAEDRIIVTSDLDYARIVALAGVDRPGVILFRAGNITDDRMLTLLQSVITQIPQEQLQTSVTMMDGFRIRVAQLPLRPKE